VGRCAWEGPGRTKNPLALGIKTVPGPSPGGDGVLAAASTGRFNGGGETAGTARHVGGGSMGRERKVTA
jgi:Asp-tRNA(Asn)/Glu-tRNA(Gln) amidotransferase A subunit family amidase